MEIFCRPRDRKFPHKAVVIRNFYVHEINSGIDYEKRKVVARGVHLQLHLIDSNVLCSFGTPFFLIKIKLNGHLISIVPHPNAGELNIPSG
jgi:hypothetical protein